jgi:crotonobetainyl-CoA:carnitine CoA-transferase CaiB-like acyl-CoA transferase
VASGSVNAVIGILGACIHRMRTGKGQYIDVSMTDGMIAFHAMTGACFLAGGAEPERERELLNGGSLYDFYETRDGGHIAVGSIEPAFFLSFCGAIGRPDLAGEGIASPDAHRIKREIRDIIRTRTRDEWREVFSSLDACVEPVLTLAEALESDHARSRGLVVDVDVPGGGKVRQIGSPIRFSETRQEYGTAGAAGGVHTSEVLAEAGYTRDEIEAFERSGVLT